MPPWASNAALARLNGREPKKPEWADIGDGWAEAICGMPASRVPSDWASLPQRIATSGPPLAASASIAHSVTSSQPFLAYASSVTTYADLDQIPSLAVYSFRPLD